MKYTQILIILSIFIFLSCQKQKELEKESTPQVVDKYGELEGSVQNEFEQKIIGALIKVNDFSTKSNQTGYYSLKLPVNKYSVSVSKESYLTEAQEIKISENETTKLDFILQAGQAYLSISDTLKQVNAINNSFVINILSNTDWSIKNNSSWLTCSSLNGGGDASVEFNYFENKGDSIRTDTILFISGTINKSLIIKQLPKIKLLKIKGILGNEVNSTSAKINLLFNLPVNIRDIKSNWSLCHSDMPIEKTDNRNEVVFNFPCAELGGKYPFTIKVSDDYGNSFDERIEVPFYKKKLDIDGYITDFLLINDDKEILFSISKPNMNKIVRYSIEMDSIVQSYSFPSNVNPARMSCNPYNSKVYIMVSGDKPELNGSKDTPGFFIIDEPDVYTLDTQTGKVSKAFTVMPYDNRVHQALIPYNLGFTKTGLGIILLKSNTTSKIKWRIIDSSKNHDISNYLYYTDEMREDNTYYNDLYLNYDNSKLYIKPAYGGCNYGIFDGSTQKISILRPSITTQSSEITPSRNTEKFYARELYQQYIVDLEGNFSPVSNIDGRHGGRADFSYKGGDENFIYICEERTFVSRNNKFVIVDYYSGHTVLMYNLIDNLHKFSTTIDGKYGVAFKINTDYDSSLYIFDTDFL